MNIGSWIAIFAGVFIALYFGIKAAKQKKDSEKKD